jgi:cytochrome c oxidase cbb3-type subunit 3
MRGEAVLAAVLGVVFAASTAGCRRETRNYRESPPAVTTLGVAVSDLHPGGGNPPGRSISPYEQNAYALAEGKRLFSAYNCVGCHANGGGGMGPALIDETWSYGHEADQIYRSILEGRPNGMPTWRGKIPDYQIWQLAAYVRSMSGLAPKDVAPGRNDDMQATAPENATKQRTPKNAGIPPAAVR